jgi:hypothetical protein
MYPLIYHLRVDEYFPYEDFEPHRFEHLRAWQREQTRRSVLGVIAAAVRRAARALSRPGHLPVRSGVPQLETGDSGG